MLVATALVLSAAPPASAIVLPPATVDGPSPTILEFGGAAMAPDGSGGLVYTKTVGGIAHVFASRFNGINWSAPIRVDGYSSFEGSQPRIAAGEGGRLLVVWVMPVGTVHEDIQRGLFSAELGPGAGSFGPSLLIDPDIGDGVAATPSLAGTGPGKAIVSYRVVTDNFPPQGVSTHVRLRPGDVMVDVRLARLGGGRWQRIGAINRNPAASMRPPSESNAAQVAIAADGGAVVAWQEPDQSGAARILMRRIFGTTPGPVLEASPQSWDGRSVSGDADGISLDATAQGQVRIAMRVEGGPGMSPAGPSVFLNTLGPSSRESAGTPTGAVLVDGSQVAGSAGDVSPPDVAAADEGGGGGSLRVAFAAAGSLGEATVDGSGKVQALQHPPGLGVTPEGAPVAAVDPAGGGTTAWPTLDRFGHPVLAVRQDLPSGASQTGLISGSGGGPISRLAIGRSGGGDALIGFRQGEPGEFEIVAERVGVAPAKLAVQAPARWVRPPRARLRWSAPRSAVGGLSYSVLLDGRVVRRSLMRLRFRPRPALLGSGVRGAQVLATDRLGQQVLSRTVKLRVDSQPPRVRIEQRPRARLAIRLEDRDAGLRVRATRVRFGDGTQASGGSKLHHAYERPGRYAIEVHARDRVGNAVTERFGVRVK